MRLLLSGEGPTDLGHEKPSTGGMAFVPGPMAWVVDKLLERHHTKYSLLDAHQTGADCVTHIHETALAALGKRGSPLFPGVKFGKGTAFFTRNAQALGLLAKQTCAQEAQPVLAVLFRDGDGVQATSSGEWREKVDSMHRGFAMVADGAAPEVRGMAVVCSADARLRKLRPAGRSFWQRCQSELAEEATCCIARRRRSISGAAGRLGQDRCR